MSNLKGCAMDFAPYFYARTSSYNPGEPTMQEAFQLRYNVYCLERQFLDPRKYPDGLETDSYDSESAHFVSHNHSGELVGYSRLIAPDFSGRFPWQEFCSEVIDGVMLPPLGETAEISRLMVRHDYRRRRGDLLSGVARQEEAQVKSTSSCQVLICASALFFRTRLVAFTTILCMICSTVLLALNKVASDPFHHALTYEATLAIGGVVVGYQVWRFRVLREYYEERR